MFEFPKSESPITVGRLHDCKVLLEDVSLSRIQCTMKVRNGRWMVTDGNGKRFSTNGTWIFLNEAIDIYDDMQIKIGQNLFRVDIKE